MYKKKSSYMWELWRVMKVYENIAITQNKSVLLKKSMKSFSYGIRKCYKYLFSY